MSKKIYEMVTERIIQMLKAGVIPWRKPWVNNAAVNWVTQKPYRGINTMLLDPGEYATFNQITQAGGRVNKGAKSSIIVFWKWIDEKDKETGEPTGETIPMLRYYNVFEINTQCTGLESKRKFVEIEHNPIEEAEQLVKGFVGGPKLIYNPGRAAYFPNTDIVSVPEKNDFPILEEYYSTLFHELVHSTGHPKRLNRPGVANFDKFGSEQYSKEELIAEMGAAMLCAMVGIENTTLDNSASYIASWLKKLKDDPKLVVQAAGQAQKAVDMIAGESDSKDSETEEKATEEAA
ncbi:ArdC family protein [Streptomyces avermitilis]